MTRRRFTHLTVTSLATSALIGCQDNTPPTAAVRPTAAPVTELAGVDTTPPVITYSLSGTLGQDNWYTDSVSVHWTVTDPESPVTTSPGTCTEDVMFNWGQGGFVCTATSAGGTSSETATFKLDNVGPRPLDPPFIETPQSAPGSGWWNTSIVVSWTCLELPEYESGAVDTMPTAVVSTEGRNQKFVGTCVDKAGNVTTREYDPTYPAPLSIDKTPPVLAPTLSSNPVLLGSTVTASPNATDALSGVADQWCGTVVTSSIGTDVINCTATDSANNTVTKSVTFTVVSSLNGFVGLNAPPALNAPRAKGSISVKFDLGGDRGLQVLAAGSPTSRAISCVTMAATGPEAPTTGSLTYSAKTHLYTYSWTTAKAWVGTCRQLVVKLADGSERRANFQFK